jgi:hypothetical protein
VEGEENLGAISVSSQGSEKRKKQKARIKEKSKGLLNRGQMLPHRGRIETSRDKGEKKKKNSPPICVGPEKAQGGQ